MPMQIDEDRFLNSVASSELILPGQSNSPTYAMESQDHKLLTHQDSDSCMCALLASPLNLDNVGLTVPIINCIVIIQYAFEFPTVFIIQNVFFVICPFLVSLAPHDFQASIIFSVPLFSIAFTKIAFAIIIARELVIPP